MFPRLRDRFGAAIDLVVEFSTLGEFGYDARAPQRAIAPSSGSDPEPGMGGAGAILEGPCRPCGERTGRVGARIAPAGGAAAFRCMALTGPTPGVPAATPAGRRRGALACTPPGRSVCLDAR